MNSDSGYTLLELTIGIFITTICMSLMIPTINRQMTDWTQLRNNSKHDVHLDWICDQICSDVQYSGTSSVVGAQLTIRGTSIITYERVGTALRRRVSGTSQTMSTVPITGWSVVPSGSAIVITISSEFATSSRRCQPW